MPQLGDLGSEEQSASIPTGTLSTQFEIFLNMAGLLGVHVLTIPEMTAQERGVGSGQKGFREAGAPLKGPRSKGFSEKSSYSRFH